MASINQNATKTTINQSTDRAAINWQSFDVGSQHAVQFNQPAATSVTLNRVIGPNPSAIAGRIDANGQVVLINQSGVVFHNGSQVNTAGLMVSASNITNENFAAGRMTLEPATNPHARVENRGQISIKEAGLAALVAPQVANSGVINARLGHVVLAGAKAATLDLYGDGLMSINVTQQVTEVPVGPDGKPVQALVTNTGVIRADGGTVQLTAKAADGLLQNLIRSGGSISAATVGTKAGTVALNAVGGSIVVEGQLGAVGVAAGTTGGNIEVAASHAVTIAGAARIDASGKAGGGTIALGTSLARAKGGPPVSAAMTSRAVVVKPGAAVVANATDKGNGGRVTTLSTEATSMAGRIEAKGGPKGGDGGFVEVSGDKGLSLTGTADVSAPVGSPGTVLLDPTDLEIFNCAGECAPGNLDGTLAETNQVLFNDGGANGTVSNLLLSQLTGNILLQAKNSITVDPNTPITLSNNTSLTLETNTGDITVNAGSPIAAFGTGTVTMRAGLTRGSLGKVVINDALSTTTGVVIPGTDTIVQVPSGSITLLADGGIQLNAGQMRTAVLNLSNITAGGVTQAGGGILAGTLQSPLGIAGPVTLPAGTLGNIIPIIGNMPVTGGGFTLVNGAATTVAGTLAAQGASITAPSIAIPGRIDVGPGVVTLVATDGGITETGGITAGLLTGSATGAATFTGATPTSNQIAGLGDFQATTLLLNDAAPLTVTGKATAGAITIADTLQVAVTGTLKADTGGDGTPTIALTGSTIAVPGTVDTTLAGTVTLTATGGGITETGTLTAGTLAGAAKGDIVLSGTTPTTNQIGTVGPFTTSGAFSLSQGGTMDVVDTIRAATITLQAPNIVLDSVFPIEATPTAGNLIVPTGGRISLVADVLDVFAPATISAPGGVVELVPLTSGSPVVISQVTATDLVITPDALAAITPATGTLRIGRLTGEAAPRAGSIIVANATNFAPLAANVELDTTGSITQAPSATVTATTLSGQAQTVTLADANAIATLGAFTTAGAFTLATTTPLTVAGPFVTGGAASLATPGNLTFAGSVNAGSLQLAAGGGITRAAGAFVAGSLAGQAGTGADFGASARIGTLGTFTVASGAFALANQVPLAIAGTLTAPRASVSAVGQITLSGNIVTSGAPGTTLTVQADRTGTGNFVQTGTSTVTGLDGATPTLRLQLPDGGGAMQLSNINAATADLILGTASGTAAGTVAAGTLLVAGANGSAELLGSVAGDTAPTAAVRAAISPAVDFRYTFNGCVIGSAFCGGVPPEPPQPPQPLPVVPPRPTDLQVTSVLGGPIQFDLIPTQLPIPPDLPKLTLIALPGQAPSARQLTDPDVVPPNIGIVDY